MAVLRTFIAIVLPAEVREALNRYEHQLGAPETRYVKWVNPDGIHLTLKFLGNVEEARLPGLAEALSRAVTGISGFSLQTGVLGAFPSVRNPRVVWLGLDGDLDALQSLFQAVEEALSALGFPREGRPFAPHLTLGRVRETARRGDREELARTLADLSVESQFSIMVEEIHVMKSELAPAGARYTSLYSIPLEK